MGIHESNLQIPIVGVHPGQDDTQRVWDRGPDEFVGVDPGINEAARVELDLVWYYCAGRPMRLSIMHLYDRPCVCGGGGCI